MSSTVYPFHDGYLTSLSVADGTAVLGLVQAGGARFRMTLDGVEALCANGFRQGNIILDLRAISGIPSIEEDLSGVRASDVMEALFPGPHAAAAGHHHDAHAAVVATRLQRVAQGEATLVVLVPAYGAELYAYCAAVGMQATTD